MAIQRLSPYIKLNVSWQPKALKSTGYTMSEPMRMAMYRAEPYINGVVDTEKYYISTYKMYSETSGMYTDAKSLRFDTATGTLHLNCTIKKTDNGIGSVPGTVTWSTSDVITPGSAASGAYNVLTPVGERTTYVVHYTPITAVDTFAHMELTTSIPKNNQPFCLSLFEYSALAEHKVQTQLYIHFGYKWLIELTQDEPPRLYKALQGQWCEVSSGPAGMFKLCQMHNIVIKPIYDTLVISDGIDYENAWVYRNLVTDSSDTRLNLDTGDGIYNGLPSVPLLTMEAPIHIYSRYHNYVIAYHPLEFNNIGTLQSPLINHGMLDASTFPTEDDGDGGLVPYMPVTAKWFWPGYGNEGYEPESGEPIVPPVTTEFETVVGNTQWQYQLTLMTINREITPYVFAVSADSDPVLVDVVHTTDWSFASDRFMGGQLKIDTRESNGSITLSNYDGAFNGMNGYLNVSIDAGYNMINTNVDGGDGYVPPQISIGSAYRPEGTNLQRLFTGYAYDPTFSRSSAGMSTVTLQLVDPSVIMKEQFAWNLPIYDGTCLYWAMYDICRRCGFSMEPDDSGFPAVLAWQNPNDASDYITLHEMLGQTDWGLCQIGLCEHVILDQGGWHAAPIYKFEDTTKLWDCLHSLSDQFKRHWIYFNNWGNLIICDPLELSDQYLTDYEFNEIVKQSDLALPYANQLHDLSMKWPGSQTRNSFSVWGMDINAMYSGKNPYRMVTAKYDLANGDEMNYRPWYNHAVIKNSKLNPNQLNAMLRDMTYVASRPRPTATFNTAGNSFVFPYDIVTINESSDTPGCMPILHGPNQMTLSPWRITAVTHDFSDTENMRYECSWEAEWVADGDKALYSQWR